jgi:hypothetical protein
VLFVANGPGNDPHNPALGRILSEQDIKVARIADARIAEVFDRLDISTEEEFRALRDDLRWIHGCREMLESLGRKAFWLAFSVVLLGVLGFCAQSTLDGIRKEMRHETRQHLVALPRFW